MLDLCREMVCICGLAEVLKGLSHETDFKNVVENGQILASIRAAAGFLIFRRLLRFLVEIKHQCSGKC